MKILICVVIIEIDIKWMLNEGSIIVWLQKTTISKYTIQYATLHITWIIIVLTNNMNSAMNYFIHTLFIVFITVYIICALFASITDPIPVFVLIYYFWLISLKNKYSTLRLTIKTWYQNPHMCKILFLRNIRMEKFIVG